MQKQKALTLFNIRENKRNVKSLLKQSLKIFKLIQLQLNMLKQMLQPFAPQPFVPFGHGVLGR